MAIAIEAVMAKENDEQRKKQSKWPLFISLGLLASLVLAYFIVPPFQSFITEAYEVLISDDKERISSWVKEFGIWGPIFVVVAMVAQMFLIVIPSPLLMVVSVLAYGPVCGAVLSVFAVLVASSIGYRIGRYFGTAAVDRLIGDKKEKKLEYYVERYGLWAVIITRLAPMLSNDAISFVGGILQMGYWRFIAATFIGITPLAVLIAYFGENNDRLKTGLLWTSGISLVLFVVYIIYDRKKNPENAKDINNN